MDLTGQLSSPSLGAPLERLTRMWPWHSLVQAGSRMNDAGVRTLGLLSAATALLLTASGSFGRALAETWAGTWATQWGPMELTQTGSKVAGTYTHDSGHITGTASGTKFKGRWTELPTRKGPNDAGAVEFTMGNDGKSITGRWTYDGSPTSWNTDWSGKCTAGRCLQNVAGGGSAPPPTGTPTGTVLVNGRPFTGGAIPYGSTVDVTNGRLLIKADTGTVTVFGAGVPAAFKLLRGTDKKKPIIEMRLVNGDFSICPKRKKSSAGGTTATPVRQLWGKGTGRFRTRGRYAAATVRGTYWLTSDRCDGTFVKVNQGVIQVNDLPRRTQVTVRAPRSYLAKP